VLQLARAAADHHGLRRFGYVSTVAVAGERKSEVVTEDESIDWNRRDYDPYGRTKKFGEHMVRTLLPDVPLTIYRPSMVIGDSRFPQTTQFDMVRAVCFLADLPIVPVGPDVRQDIVNADWVGRALAHLHMKETPAHDCYHLSAGTSALTARQIGEAICLALSEILPERSAPQVYKLGMPNTVLGFDEAGLMWMDQGVDVRASDASATQGLDGWGSMCAGLGNLCLAEAEDAESRFPVLNIGREMTTDTGGAGRWRGQPGTLNVKQVLAEATGVSWMVSRKHPLRGLCGGDNGSPYGLLYEVGTDAEYEIENAVQAPLPSGAITAYQYGGGGGFGDPLERDPDAVLEDVLDEYVSVEAARERYGVALTGTLEEWNVRIDARATKALRKQLAQNRGTSA
jgi:hypothetical protein